MELIPNRKKETIIYIINKYINSNSIIYTDGYPSYPAACHETGFIHVVVNHTLGFVTEDGVHTNNIENLWSHFKYEYRTRAGINKSRFDCFLNEFIWKKKNLKLKNKETLKNAFLSIVQFFSIN